MPRVSDIQILLAKTLKHLNSSIVQSRILNEETTILIEILMKKVY